MNKNETLRGAVIGRVYKASEKEEFFAMLKYLEDAKLKADARIYLRDFGEFDGGIILSEIQPRKEIEVPYFLRFTRYEALRFPLEFRKLLRRQNNTVTGTITRSVCGTIYEAHFTRYGYNIVVTDNISLMHLKEKFIKAVNAAELTTDKEAF